MKKYHMGIILCNINKIMEREVIHGFGVFYPREILTCQN